MGFLSLGGFFVSFMSGNSTRLGVGVASASFEAIVAARLVAAFVVGVIVGSLIGRQSSRHRQPLMLVLVAGLLAIASLIAAMDAPDIAVLIMAGAMGVENTMFERDGEVSVGLTYMTGALVKLGQRLAALLAGGPPWDWLPYALLWLSLVFGATIGAFTFSLVRLNGLWAGSAVALVLVIAALLVAPRRPI
jgi:uncharacterized membrane protein YoaK (UPF0700 family)